MVENDPLFPEDIQQAGIKQLQERNIKHETETYRGVQHGESIELLFSRNLHCVRFRSGW